MGLFPTLLVYDSNGQQVCRCILPNKTFVVSADEDADEVVPALKDLSFFISPLTSSSYKISVEGRLSQTLNLKPALPQTADKYHFLFVFAPKVTGGLKVGGSSGQHEQNLLDLVIQWTKAPVGDRLNIHDKSLQLLDELLVSTPASNAVIIHCKNNEFSLNAYAGISEKEALKMWESLPQETLNQVLKQESKIMLPDGLQGKAGDHTTIYVKGIKSVAGFPIIVNGEVIALLYVGFKNLVTDLSSDLQNQFCRVADLLGIQFQFALIKEELVVAKLENQKAKGGKNSARLMLSESKVMDTVYHQIEKVAKVDLPVLITGETGTGKELAAREVHRLSNRAHKTFVAVNCAAIPDTLLESHLFGHKKGAFTGAVNDQTGIIMQADGGTLFLDELGEIPLNIQIKLLRVLQEKMYTRVGETVERKVDFRLVSATHQDLQKKIAEESFRQDFYFRVAGIMVKLPALRDRVSDILLLANFFKQKFASANKLPDKRWSKDAIYALESYSWPGNVRELEHAVCRSFIMASTEEIEVHDLNLESLEDGEGYDTIVARDGETLAEAKDKWLYSFIKSALIKHNGNRNETAAAIGIGQRTLFRYIEQLNIKDQ